MVSNICGIRVFTKTMYETPNPKRVTIFHHPVKRAALGPHILCAKSSYLVDPVMSAHFTSNMPQKYEIMAPKITRSAPSTIPFSAAIYGSVIVPAPRVAAIKLKIEGKILPFW